MEKTKSKTQSSSRRMTNGKTNGKSEKKQGGGPAELREFFVEELKDIYWAEKHLVKALTKLQKASTSEELSQAFGDHLTATEEHVKRLEQIFETLGEKPRGKKCDGMEGIVKEWESVIEETEKDTSLRDAGLIIAAQKAEHYEIATYGSLVQLAKIMGQEEISGILEQTLEEEKETDKLLTEIAMSQSNAMAASESEEKEKENDEEME